MDPYDTDSDELPDSWEMEHFDNLNQDPDEDFDGDGYSNLQEYNEDTDPGDREDYPGYVKPREEASNLIQILGILLLVVVIIIVLLVFLKRKRSNVEEIETSEEHPGSELESEVNDSDDFIIMEETEEIDQE
jgi:flagellar biosynthesis/type III secretory pathway M-ring protein FliF/YscJ